jgi:hypothetical protein
MGKKECPLYTQYRRHDTGGGSVGSIETQVFDGELDIDDLDGPSRCASLVESKRIAGRPRQRVITS